MSAIVQMDGQVGTSSVGSSAPINENGQTGTFFGRVVSYAVVVDEVALGLISAAALALGAYSSFKDEQVDATFEFVVCFFTAATVPLMRYLEPKKTTEQNIATQAAVAEQLVDTTHDLDTQIKRKEDVVAREEKTLESAPEQIQSLQQTIAQGAEQYEILLKKNQALVQELNEINKSLAEEKVLMATLETQLKDTKNNDHQIIEMNQAVDKQKAEINGELQVLGKQNQSSKTHISDLEAIVNKVTLVIASKKSIEDALEKQKKELDDKQAMIEELVAKDQIQKSTMDDLLAHIKELKDGHHSEKARAENVELIAKIKAALAEKSK